MLYEVITLDSNATRSARRFQLPACRQRGIAAGFHRVFVAHARVLVVIFDESRRRVGIQVVITSYSIHYTKLYDLMSEFLGYAYYAEIPAVIFNVQRTGPSTGMPTRTQQADILACAYASHGDTRHRNNFV